MIIKHPRSGLIRRGVHGYADTEHKLLSTDSLNLGPGSQSFSLRYWMYCHIVWINSFLFDNQIVNPRFSLITGGLDSNNVVAEYAFKVDDRDTIVRNSISAGHILQNNKTYYLGFDRITNNVNNWKYVYNNIVSQAWIIDFNNMLESDVLAISNPAYLSSRFFASNHGIDGALNMFSIFQPALSEVQNAWLYNNGKGNNPFSQAAKTRGIGIAGVDTIGQNGITTLLLRFLDFDRLFTQGGSEYVREHVTNNNQYAQLTGYAAGDKKIINYT